MLRYWGSINVRCSVAARVLDPWGFFSPSPIWINWFSLVLMRTPCQTSDLLHLRRSRCCAKEILLHWEGLNLVVLAAVTFSLPAGIWETPQYLLWTAVQQLTALTFRTAGVSSVMLPSKERSRTLSVDLHDGEVGPLPDLAVFKPFLQGQVTFGRGCFLKAG